MIPSALKNNCFIKIDVGRKKTTKWNPKRNWKRPQLDVPLPLKKIIIKLYSRVWKKLLVIYTKKKK